MNYLQTELNQYFSDALSGKRVFLTGHTGFKGSWLSEWLIDCGADVYGYALEPATKPDLFSQLNLANRMGHVIADVRDRDRLRQEVLDFQPDYVFHLAAQPLVVASYDDPVTTFETNIMGTIHLLEALRAVQHPCVAILVTSDKCYRNDNSGQPFKETDSMGGDDPYSASKGAMEIVSHSYRRSFFSDSPVKVATVRAGNVIGGGDYADNRIIPDCIRSLSQAKPVKVRNPNHTRPFQHVLEPLSGYMWLACQMANGWIDEKNTYAFNFGPLDEGHRSVRELVEVVMDTWPGSWETPGIDSALEEAGKLALSISRARDLLTWEPRWEFSLTIRQTIDWYRKSFALPDDDCDARIALTRESIEAFATPNV